MKSTKPIRTHPRKCDKAEIAFNTGEIIDRDTYLILR